MVLKWGLGATRESPHKGPHSGSRSSLLAFMFLIYILSMPIGVTTVPCFLT